MKDEKILFETAKLAKEKGFNWKCLNVVDNQEFELLNPYYSINSELIKTACTRPTQSLLQKWLREVHKISICVDFRHSETNKIEGINSVYYDVNIYRISQGDAFKTIKISQVNDNYEKVLEVGLQEALKLIK